MEGRSLSPPQPTPPTLVMKFGGTSIGTPEAMSRAVEIVRSNLPDWPRLVVVVSALTKVTDMLLETTAMAIDGDHSAIHMAESRLREMHFALADSLFETGISTSDSARSIQVKQEIDNLITGLTNLYQAVAVLGEATPCAVDAIVAHGERLCIRLMASALELRGVPALPIESTQLILTDQHYQAAHPDLEGTTRQTRQVLEPVLARGVVPVVTGFIGATSKGITTTLGRGGSDYSAALLGAALPADDVWIWTDVNGVMTADPNTVTEARTVEMLSYREIAELAYFGAKVLHPKAIRPVIEAGIGLRICNTFNPQHPGTRLISNGYQQTKVLNGMACLKAVTAIRGQRMIMVEGRGMLGVPGVAARTFNAVASTGASVALITQASSEQSICFAIPAEAAGPVSDALNAAFRQELAVRDIDCIHVTGEVAIITVVGAGMNKTPGIAGQIFSALGKQGVNIVAIAQGSSDVATSLVVEQSDADVAVRAIHELILTAQT
jgi:bifunctional aspartokinase / homoserine dehydrogenase 1